MTIALSSSATNRAIHQTEIIPSKEYRLFRALPNWVKAIVVRRSEEYGADVYEVMGKLRYRNIVHARHAAFYDLRTTPSPFGKILSQPQIGRMFGYTDHSNIGHGSEAHAYRNGLPPIGNWNIDRRYQRNRERHRLIKAGR